MPRCQFMMIALVGLAVVCLTVSHQARAGDERDSMISMDSRVYQSDVVIEGRLVEAKTGSSANGANVRVTCVYHGAVNVGETILIKGIGDFRKPSGVPNREIPLGPKDHLIFFLRKTP